MRSVTYVFFAVVIIFPFDSKVGAQQQTAFRNKLSTWPQWRGPNRDCQITGNNWPNSLKGNRLKEQWRVTFQESYSGPIVTQERVFVTETRNKTTEGVYALDRNTGKQLWKTQWPGSLSVPFFAARNGSWIRSTPAYDGERLYVAGMRDLLVCLNAEDGKELWRFDFTKEFKTSLPAFGFVCSPLVDDDFVYVQAGGAFVKLDKLKGKLIWRTLQDGGGMFGSAFSSPIFATIKGKKQLLVQTRTTLAGVDAETGKAFWSQEIPAFRGMNILTPTVFQDGIFTSSYGGKSFYIEPMEKGGKYSVKVKWTNKAQGYMSSPVIIGDYLYTHLRSQNFACFDLKTGDQKWISDKRFDEYWSLVVQGDKILALDQSGILYLIKANPQKLEILDERKVSKAETWAHLAVCDNQVFIRELYDMVAYKWE